MHVSSFRGTPPSSALQLHTDQALDDPYPLYEVLRDMAPAVWLPNVGEGVYAIARHADVKHVLSRPTSFASSNGVALTHEFNQAVLAGTVLAADGGDHSRLRRPLSRQLNPRAIRTLTAKVNQQADRLVDDLVSRGTFDAATDLAQQFVADVVLELMGLPGSVRDELIQSGAALFDQFGPANERARASAPAAARMFAFLENEISRDAVPRDSWLGALFEEADAGGIREADVVPLASAYTTASLDTTRHAITTAVCLLAQHPEQFADLRDLRVTPRDAFHEALRYEAPVQAFGRRVIRDSRVGEGPESVYLEAGEQVWLLYGSAGRDQRRWGPSADEFDINRLDPGDHLALGHGRHACAGGHLAELQGKAVLRALADRCARLELVGPPVRALNNTLRGWASVPVRATSP